MKKLLVLAMVLVLAAPMFAEMTIFGEFDYYMVNGFKEVGAGDPNSFVDLWDKGEVDFKGTIGDYSQIRIELEEDGSWNGRGYDFAEGTPSFNYFREFFVGVELELERYAEPVAKRLSQLSLSRGRADKRKAREGKPYGPCRGAFADYDVEHVVFHSRVKDLFDVT